MKTVLITGCSSGYGRATATHFLERGWNVVATMRSPQKALGLPRVRAAPPASARRDRPWLDRPRRSATASRRSAGSTSSSTTPGSGSSRRSRRRPEQADPRGLRDQHLRRDGRHAGRRSAPSRASRGDDHQRDVERRDRADAPRERVHREQVRDRGLHRSALLRAVVRSASARRSSSPATDRRRASPRTARSA